MPNLDRLTFHQLDTPTTDWFVGVLEVIERLDVDAYTNLMSDDVTLQLPGGAIVRGREAVADTLRPSWRTIASLEHTELSIAGNADQVVHEAAVSSTDHAGNASVSNVTAWLRRTPDGLIASARIYS